MLHFQRQGGRSVSSPRNTCETPTRRRRALNELRLWYQRWVRMREARYQYLAAILDGRPLPQQVLPPQRSKTDHPEGDAP